MRPNRLQINPLFDTELDQWLFVGELRRSIYISPVGDYDFDGIDTTEFTVSDKSALNLSSVKCHQFLSETTFSRQQKRCSISLHRRTSASVPTRSPGHQTTTYDCVLSSAHLSLRGCAKLVVAASGSRDSRNLFIEICTVFMRKTESKFAGLPCGQRRRHVQRDGLQDLVQNGHDPGGRRLRDSRRRHVLAPLSLRRRRHL